MTTKTAVAEQVEAKAEKKSADVSGKLSKILEAIEQLTVLELSQLVKALEEKFGVSAQAAVAVAVPAGAAAGGAQAGAAGGGEEKTTFQVVLTSAGDKKIQVIKEIRTVTNLGLKEAKDLVESAPKMIKDNATKEEAAKMKQVLEAAGGKVEIK